MKSKLTLTKKIIIVASSGFLGLLGYPALKNVYPIRKEATIVNNYVDLPTATADLTKDIIQPEGVGAGTYVPVDVSHWLLLSLLKSKSEARRERSLSELARQRRWNDAECIEIAQALDRQNIIRLARLQDTDLRLFLPPPSIDFLEKTLKSDKIEKIVKEILKEASERIDACSSCTNFYTNLSIRIRPDSNVLAMNDINQVESVRINTRQRIKSDYSDDIIKLKAVLNNIICNEEQALSMVNAGLLVALLYFRHKYKDDTTVDALLAQILANLSAYRLTKDHLFINGWIQTLTIYSRSKFLELSMPAAKALANLDEDFSEKFGIYGNHVYLLYPQMRTENEPNFDVIFVHGLVGSVFKSWRQGTSGKDLEEETTELLNFSPPLNEKQVINDQSNNKGQHSRCWPKDWLAHDVDGLRILALDYPTALSNWRTDCDINKDSLEQRAQHVMRQLQQAKVGDRPIVWVTHSMGGLLVKQILVSCYETELERTKDNTEAMSQQTLHSKLLNQTKGIVFYSVPHKGSNLDWIERKNLQKLLMLTTEVIELQKDSPVLLNLHSRFLKMLDEIRDNNIRFLTFRETAISTFGVNKVVQWKGILVHEDSLKFEVGPSYKLNIDHAHSCKPSSKNSLTYVTTLQLIKDLAPKQKTDETEDELLPFISFVL